MSPPNGHGQDAGKTQTFSLAAPESMRSLRIALVFYRAAGAEIALLQPGIPLVVGRAPAAGLCIDDRSLSREHARFRLEGERVHVEDLGSKNGTVSLGRRVERAELLLGDEVILGAVRVRVQPLGASGESLGVDGEEVFRRQLDEELARAAQFHRPFALFLVQATDLSPAEPSMAAGAGVSWLEVLRRRLRPVDRMAAYGVDAAYVLLPETGADEALRIADAIAAPLPDANVRLLAGVATYPDAGPTAEALVERSRQALRRASAARPVELAPARAWPADEPQEEVVADPAMRELFATIDRVAPSRLPVILHGETGTGKEVLARRIHEAGPRKGRRMVRVNCAAIPKELVESTLFGHERGAFTGAVAQQKGVFEEANGGTVFLDEIGELPPPAQAALLRVLESGSFCRVGSTREIAVDARIVVATNRDLEAMVHAGAFRADLYYRLSGIVLEIPPLRQRKVEIEPLAQRFLRLANEANGRRVEGMTDKAMHLLMAHSWPGNVRELRNAIERAVVVTRGALIGAADLPARVRDVTIDPERVSEPAGASTSSPVPPLSPPLDVPHAHAPARDKLQQYEGKLLRDTLEATRWNRAEAAQRLGMPLRTLAYRMKVLGIKKPSA